MNFEAVKFRCQINLLSNQGYSVRDISKKLKCSVNTVQKWNKGEYQDFDFSRKVGSGRKRKINDEDIQTVEQILEDNIYLGSRQLTEKIEQETEQNISDRTVRRYAASLGYKWGRARPKPVLSETNKQKRLEWCLNHREEDWKCYIFSDEKLFRCGLAPVGMRYKKGEQKIYQTFRGPIFHIWNAINYFEKFPILQVPTRMDDQQYIELLSTAFKEHFKDGMIFQQDNAPPHKSENTQDWLDFNDYYFEEFPPYSPDLNPIENLWAIVSVEVRKRNPKTLAELKSFVIEEMGKVSRKQVRKLINSMTHRIEQCIQRNGDYTDY
jgi:transposase